MRLRSIVGAVAVLAAGLVAGCTGGQGATTAQGAYAQAQTALQQQLVGLGFTDVEVLITTETDDTKAKPSPTRSTRPTPGKTSATPKAQRTSAAPKTTTVTYAILSATAGHPSLSCRVNVEQRLDPLGAAYFDEVMLPGTDGVEVVGEARTSLTPADVVFYITSAHPECLVVTPAVPTTRATNMQAATPDTPLATLRTVAPATTPPGQQQATIPATTSPAAFMTWA
jgi:hypothetical protein